MSLDGTIAAGEGASASSPGRLLELRGVGKTYSRRGAPVAALADINLSVDAGSFVSIVGRSGCGKSTLLRLVAGLNVPTSGDLRLAGIAVAVPPAIARCVFQDYGQSLLAWKTVLDNVRFGAVHACDGRLRSATEQIAEASALLELVGLGKAADRFPWELSGGMQQRVAIARALASAPSLLLMDEPFSSVDALSRATLQDIVLRVWSELRTTIVFVTHDIDEAVYLSDRVIVLDQHGRGVQADIAVDLERPRNQLTTREAPGFLAARREVLRLVLKDGNQQ